MFKLQELGRFVLGGIFQFYLDESHPHVSCIWHASFLDLVSDLGCVKTQFFICPIFNRWDGELCSYLVQNKVKSCENPLNTGLILFRNGFGAPKREERVKRFSLLDVHTRLCSRKRKGQPWWGSEDKSSPRVRLCDLLERREPTPASVLSLTHTWPLLKGNPNVNILLWKVNVFSTACVCVYVFHNVNS